MPFELATDLRARTPHKHKEEETQPNLTSNEYWASRWQGTLTKPQPFAFATEERFGMVEKQDTSPR